MEVEGQESSLRSIIPSEHSDNSDDDNGEPNSLERNRFMSSQVNESSGILRLDNSSDDSEGSEISDESEPDQEINEEDTPTVARGRKNQNGENLITAIFGDSGDDEDEEAPTKSQKKSTRKQRTSKKKALAKITPKTKRKHHKIASSEDLLQSQANVSEKTGILHELDMVLANKRKMNARRRQRKYDDINNLDDQIHAFVEKMKIAALDDIDSFSQGKPGTKKLQMLPKVVREIKRANAIEPFMDAGIFTVFTMWLSPSDDGSLPNLQIRSSILKILADLPTPSISELKQSNLGKAVMILLKHPSEHPGNIALAEKLIQEWSRPIFGKAADMSRMSKADRQLKDMNTLKKYQKLSNTSTISPHISVNNSRFEDAALTANKTMESEKDLVMRARVPKVIQKDYIIRPLPSVSISPRKRKLGQEEDSEKPNGSHPRSVVASNIAALRAINKKVIRYRSKLGETSKRNF